MIIHTHINVCMHTHSLDTSLVTFLKCLLTSGLDLEWCLGYDIYLIYFLFFLTSVIIGTESTHPAVQCAQPITCLSTSHNNYCQLVAIATCDNVIHIWNTGNLLFLTVSIIKKNCIFCLQGFALELPTTSFESPLHAHTHTFWNQDWCDHQNQSQWI